MGESATKVWLGTAGWSYLPDWAGSFYPPGTTSADTLRRYVEAFRFVEIDATFYATPAFTTIERWSRIMPPDFRVACKAPKELVQDTSLAPPDVPFRLFCESLAYGLGDRLAMIVVQMQPSFARSASNVERLRAFVDRWVGGPVRFGVEFRDPSWNVPDVKDFLREHDVTMVSNDLHDVPSLGRQFFDTSDTCAYIRLIGRHDGMSKDRIQRPQNDGRLFWADRVVRLVERGVGHVYVVANNHYEGHAPQTLRTLTTELAERGVQVVDSSGWPNGPVSLF